MAQGFRPRRGAYVARLDVAEREIVAELMRQTLQLVQPEQRTSTGDPFADLVAQLGDAPDPDEVAERDPVLRRLLPDAHRDDPQAAAEFRSATEHALRERKSANLRRSIAALEGGDRVRLDRDGAVAMMLALADVRLALAERLGVVDDADGERLSAEIDALDGPPTDPRLVAGMYYDFLTWLQEGLAVALMP